MERFKSAGVYLAGKRVATVGEVSIQELAEVCEPGLVVPAGSYEVEIELPQVPYDDFVRPIERMLREGSCRAGREADREARAGNPAAKLGRKLEARRVLLYNMDPAVARYMGHASTRRARMKLRRVERAIFKLIGDPHVRALVSVRAAAHRQNALDR